MFLLGVPVMALLLLAGPALLPEYRDPRAGRLDALSVVLSLAAILPVVYGLKAMAKDAWGLAPVSVLVAGVPVGIVFVRRRRRLADPLVDLRLFGVQAFSAALAFMLLGGVVLGRDVAARLPVPPARGGLAPLRAGLWLLPVTVAIVAGTARRGARGVHRGLNVTAGIGAVLPDRARRPRCRGVAARAGE